MFVNKIWCFKTFGDGITEKDINISIILYMIIINIVILGINGRLI